MLFKRCLCEKNTNIAIIPGGLTSYLQPLDVSLNKAFKAKISIKNTLYKANKYYYIILI